MTRIDPSVNYRVALRRWRGVLMSLCLVMFVAGCSGHDGEDAIRFGLSAAPTNLDPRFATDATSGRINRLVYDSLVDFDEHFNLIPALATWDELSPTHYRFHLAEPRPLFHDGSRLSAGDVKATYDSILDEQTGSPHRGNLAGISHVEIVDAATIDFQLTKADPLFPSRLTIGILPAGELLAGHAFRNKPIGTGPFYFVEWPDEGHLILNRSRDEQRFEFLSVKEPTVRVLKLLRGEVDIIQNDLQPELVDYLRGNEDVSVMRGDGTRFSYLGFNLQDPALSDIRVRKAIALALDREQIIRYVFGGAARLANALLPPEHWAGNSQLTAYAFDSEGARDLLAELGYGPQTPLHLVYKTSSDPFRIRLATIIQHQLAQVGIEVELQSFDWGTFYGDIKAGRFQMFSLSWVGIKTPDIFRYVFHSESVPPVGANRGRFVNVEVDRLIDAAEATATLEEQAPIYRDLQVVLWRELPYVPLWYEDNVVAVNKRISGYKVAGDGNFDGLRDVELN